MFYFKHIISWWYRPKKRAQYLKFDKIKLFIKTFLSSKPRKHFNLSRALSCLDVDLHIFMVYSMVSANLDTKHHVFPTPPPPPPSPPIVWNRSPYSLINKRQQWFEWNALPNRICFNIHNYPFFSSYEIAVGKNVRQQLK